MLGFACFTTFWTLSVHLLQQIPRERYDDQNKYWVVATVIAWCFDVFITEPLFTWVLGGTRFYQFRPYFYDYTIGETYKEIEN